MEKVPITQSHISVQYVLINALSSTLLEDVDCVFWVPMQCYQWTSLLQSGYCFDRYDESPEISRS